LEGLGFENFSQRKQSDGLALNAEAPFAFTIDIAIAVEKSNNKIIFGIADGTGMGAGHHHAICGAVRRHRLKQKS
jgi:hypothetical protein